MLLRSLPFALALGLTLPACSTTVDSPKLSGPETRRVVVEIVYGPGAEPMTERSDGSHPFTRVQSNLERAFLGTGKTLEIPTTLAEMRLAPEIVGDRFTIDDAIDLGLSERRRAPNDDTRVIVVVYVPGSFVENSNLLGDTRSVKGVTAIAVGAVRAHFLPMGPQGEDFVADAEQVLLIHELGHELGLVDAGLPMASPHLDNGDDGHHCENPRCVMHTSSGLGAMNLPGFKEDDGLVLFGDECLGDILALVKATH